jgi:hypothetical protein
MYVLALRLPVFDPKSPSAESLPSNEPGSGISNARTAARRVIVS